MQLIQQIIKQLRRLREKWPQSLNNESLVSDLTKKKDSIKKNSMKLSVRGRKKIMKNSLSLSLTLNHLKILLTNLLPQSSDLSNSSLKNCSLSFKTLTRIYCSGVWCGIFFRWALLSNLAICEFAYLLWKNWTINLLRGRRFFHVGDRNGDCVLLWKCVEGERTACRDEETENAERLGFVDGREFFCVFREWWEWWEP